MAAGGTVEPLSASVADGVLRCQMANKQTAIAPEGRRSTLLL